jgi:hypothetical protein
MVDVNYLAILVAGIANMIVGGLWYSPVLFAKPWMALNNMTEESMKNAKPGPLYAQAFVASLVMYYVLAHIIHYTNAATAMDGAKTAFWVWLGFITTVQFTANLFSPKKIGAYFIDTGYQFVTTIVAGVILAVWK